MGRSCHGSRLEKARYESLLVKRLGVICQQLIGGKHLWASLPVEPSYWQTATAIAGENDELDRCFSSRGGEGETRHLMTKIVIQRERRRVVELFAPYEEVIRKDFPGYRNHVFRTITYAFP